MFLVEKLLLIFNISCLFVFINHFLLVSFQALSGFEKISDSAQISIFGAEVLDREHIISFNS